MELFNKISSDEDTKLNLDKHGKTDRIDASKPVKDAAKPLEDKFIKLTLSKGFGSSRCNKNKFSNFLETLNSTNYCDAVNKIFKLLNNDDCTVESLPFDLDEDLLNVGRRQNDILYKSNLHNSIIKETIGKATYRDEVSKGIYSHYKTRQPIRLFFIERNNNNIKEIELILIDLYHLFAISNPQKIQKQYDAIKRYNIDMIRLLKNDSSL